MPRDLPALASKKLQLILENHDLELGTTFPPRTRSIKTRSNQFHSETNLNRLEDDNEVNYIFYSTFIAFSCLLMVKPNSLLGAPY